MIRVDIEIDSEKGRVLVAVCARSIERALALVEDRYAGGRYRVLFPLRPETFFVRETEEASALEEILPHPPADPEPEPPGTEHPAYGREMPPASGEPSGGEPSGDANGGRTRPWRKTVRGGPSWGGVPTRRGR